MEKRERDKHRLVIFPFYIFIGAIAWGLITSTPLIGLLGKILSILAVTYFLIHVHEFYFKDKFKKSKKSKINDD